MSLAPLDPSQTTRGSDPSLLADEYMTVVKGHIAAHPRSLQTQIGPSELGHPCPRRVAYKLIGHPEREREAAWKPTVGTAVHEWLETAFDADNLAFEQRTKSGQERWYVETRVNVGTVGGIDITGSCDLYDRVSATVIDHKIVGTPQLRNYKANGPGDQYRTQAHLYGRGFVRAGLPVDTVMIAFLPRNGELRDAYMWHEPYDEQVALDALARADALAMAVNMFGYDAVAQQPHVDAHCNYCPFFQAGSQDPTKGCAGYPRQAEQPFSDLLAG